MRKVVLTESELTAVLTAAALTYNPSEEASNGLEKLGKLAEEFITNRDPKTKAYEFCIEPFKPAVAMYTYYRVDEERDVYIPDLSKHHTFVKNELLTKYFYEKYAKGVKAILVKVPEDTCYYFFGVRFSTLFDNDK